MNSICEPEIACQLLPFPILWERQVESAPGVVAVVTELRQWTYAELDQQAEAMATLLHRQGVRRGERVGLCLDRSCEAIAAMIGVMKAGAAFVPLDPQYPRDRLQYMLRDAEINCVIGTPAYRELFLPPTAKSENLCWLNPCSVHSEGADACVHIAAQQADSIPRIPRKHDEPRSELRGDDIAYVMYTSGSTGKPKGVVISHRALTTYCLADIECYKITPSDRTLQFSTLNFDIAIEEIFPPLLTGGSVVVRPSHREGTENELSSIIDRFSVTAVHLATAYWHSWVDLMLAIGTPVPRSLRLMIVTGEKVSIEHYRRWQSLCDHDVLWCNAYGPTEATVTATVFIPDEHFDSPERPATSMPIGRPLPRYEAYVLDEHLRAVLAGEAGQLYLAGPALAEGYLNRPDLTEAVFIDAELDGELRRLYKTGDLARWLPDGTLDFGGRIDDQIKLGSYRVEPGEIESAINTYAGIHESLIRYDEVDGRKYLIAYVATGKPAGGNARDAQAMLATALAAHLREMLPAYMIPTRYVFMAAFPKTINGKIDRESLPGPDSAYVARDSHYDAPQNQRQHYLAGLWQNVLNVPQVGIHDDFFLLGGSSLLVTRVVARVATDLRVVLPVRDFFANPTVATLSNHLNALLSDSHDTYQADELYSTAILHRLPIVQPLFIESVAGRLYAVRYQPRSVRKEHAILFAHSLGHEYVRGHRNLQQLAMALCERGFDVIRFDYLGTGDSDGLCEEVNAETMGSDLVNVRRHIMDQANVRSVSLIGLRLGATVATHYRDAFQAMVIWDPVPSGKAFLELLDRFHLHALTSGMKFHHIRTDADENQRYGHRMDERKRESFVELKMNASIQDCDVVLSKDEGAPFPDALAATNRIHRVGDEIIWNDPSFAESAFSSPEAYRVILNIFEEIKL